MNKIKKMWKHCVRMREKLTRIGEEPEDDGTEEENKGNEMNGVFG